MDVARQYFEITEHLLSSNAATLNTKQSSTAAHSISFIKKQECVKSNYELRKLIITECCGTSDDAKHLISDSSPYVSFSINQCIRWSGYVCRSRWSKLNTT